MSFEVLGPTDPLMAMKMLIQVIQCLDGDVFVKMWSGPVFQPLWPRFYKEDEVTLLPQVMRWLQCLIGAI